MGRPPSTNNAVEMWGCKVDRAEFSLDQGEPVIVEVSFACKDGTFETETYSAPSIVYIHP